MARLSRPPTARTRLTLTRASALRLPIKEAATANRRRGVPSGGCGKQAMDGLRRRVRHGCLPSGGASPARDAAASEARVQTVCPGRYHPSARRRTFLLHGRCRRAEKSGQVRSEEHTSELQSLMRKSYSVFCLKKKTDILISSSNPSSAS